jgi:hypothetical protein
VTMADSTRCILLMMLSGSGRKSRYLEKCINLTRDLEKTPADIDSVNQAPKNFQIPKRLIRRRSCVWSNVSNSIKIRSRYRLATSVVMSEDRGAFGFKQTFSVEAGPMVPFLHAPRRSARQVITFLQSNSQKWQAECLEMAWALQAS